MAISFLSANSNKNSVGATVTVALSIGVGDFIIINAGFGVTSGSPPTVLTVSDNGASGGNAYTNAVTRVFGTRAEYGATAQREGYCYVCSSATVSATSISIAATAGGTVPSIAVCAARYGGVLSWGLSGAIQAGVSPYLNMSGGVALAPSNAGFGVTMLRDDSWIVLNTSQFDNLANVGGIFTVDAGNLRTNITEGTTYGQSTTISDIATGIAGTATPFLTNFGGFGILTTTYNAFGIELSPVLVPFSWSSSSTVGLTV